ncbi:Ppx/GppA phosphatase family protein [Halorhodospira halochloris]|uniref:Ppx/GppA phosphatase family protein n=1 Tax=Halorhodospira halochloris TaxID=1052 RepID=UPI00308457E9
MGADSGEQVVAAVDLGSNSFHMIVAGLSPDTGTLRVIDRLRETVRLAEGLTDQEKNLNCQARERALACLQRFGERLRHFDPGNVRVVGTNTLRRARDADQLMREAEQVLGHPIEVVSGYEEARLVYLGVAHSLGFDSSRRLVVDIGGGSTEIIIGEGESPLQMESMHLGCVRLNNEFFGDGRITAQRMEQAVLQGRLELEPVEGKFRASGWQSAVGASGTVRAVAHFCTHMYATPPGVITADALLRLRKALVEDGSCKKLAAQVGLSADRQIVFPPGVAALSAVFEALDIDRMEVSDGAMREGLLYDLGGRAGLVAGAEDARDASVAALRRRYSVDAEQADRVSRTAMRLHSQVASTWGVADQFCCDILDWAAQLHEVGLDISHAQYHKHGAYILNNADMAGFSRQEQQLLAFLVRVHRRKLARSQISALPQRWTQIGTRLALLLRQAVLLHRSRSEEDIAEPRIQPLEDGLRVSFAGSALEDNPLLRADLEQEQRYLSKAGWRLEFVP